MTDADVLLLVFDETCVECGDPTVSAASDFARKEDGKPLCAFHTGWGGVLCFKCRHREKHEDVTLEMPMHPLCHVYGGLRCEMFTCPRCGAESDQLDDL